MGAPSAAPARPEEETVSPLAGGAASIGATARPMPPRNPFHRQSLGLTMLDSIVDAAKLKHVSSKDDLEQAFRKREVAVTALKAKMSKVRGPARPQGPAGERQLPEGLHMLELHAMAAHAGVCCHANPGTLDCTW